MEVPAEDRTRALAELASALTAASTDVAAVLATAAYAARLLVGESVIFRLTGPDGMLETVKVEHHDPEMVELLRQMLGTTAMRFSDGLIGETAKTHQPLVDNEVTVEKLVPVTPLAMRPYLPRLNVHAILAVPLIGHGDYLGHLAFARHGPGHPYTPDEVALATDVAARVGLALATAQTVERLRISEAGYRQIVETSLEGVWKTDLDLVTTFVNGRMAEILGVTRKDMIGKPVSPYLKNPEDPERYVRRAQRLAGLSEVYETQLRRADGTLVWVLAAASAIRDEAGRTTGILGMVTDITDRVRARDLAQRLEQLQRLDSLGQLAGGIAHDFNNLMSIIRGCTDLLGDTLPAASPQADYLSQIASATAKGADLTGQLMAFGRGHAGRTEVLDLSHVVEALAPLLHRTLGEHVVLDIPGWGEHHPACRVRMDRGQLEQVIVNLAVNARDAMDSGGRLRIECEQVVLDPAEFTLGRENTPEKGWYARMSVSDTGCGMEPDTLARAFEPFFTTKGPAHGTGLGLASVYGIVRNSGGTVRIYSEPGRGTTVKVHLPLSDEQPMVAEPVASPAFQRDAMPARILVVEDSPELAEVVLRLLRPAGYTVTIAYSAVDALALLAAGEAVDLLVTDVVMPGMTGPELVKAVRPAHPTMPVLYTSGYTAGILGARAHLEPDATFIEKPFTRGALLSMVAKLLSRQ